MTVISKHSNWFRLLFYLGLALLATHELDAVARHEWRMLPVLSGLDDQTGRLAFILIHIPLFTILFWLSGHHNDIIRIRTQVTVDIILIVHGILHFSLSGSPLYEFEAPVETITIFGGAFVGLLHLSVYIFNRPHLLLRSKK